MTEKIGLFIKDNASLIENDLISRAGKLATTVLSDAMESFGAMDYSIKPAAPGMKVVGTALTVNLRPGDNLFLHKATYLAGKGYVLVADSKGHTDNACWGELMTRVAIAVGVEGVVIDGVIRDIAAIRELGFPVFAKGAIPNGVNRFGPGEINGAISCGGRTVCPGDLIVGDDDGVVVIQRDNIEEVISLAEQKTEQEEKRIRDIAEGRLEPGWMNERFKYLGI